jgi:ligand-binding sensor domain-containing protein
MPLCRAILLLGLLLVWPVAIRGQALTLSHLTTEQGLSSNAITAVYQGSRGYLWVGTNGGGLNRYDGYEVKTYR